MPAQVFNPPPTDSGDSHVYLSPWGYYAVIAGTWYPEIVSGTHYRLRALALNDEIQYRVYLPAGTFYIDTVINTNNDHGVLNINFDGVNHYSQDCYSAGSVTNVFIQSSLITTTSAGWHEINLVVPSKNGASSNYTIEVDELRIKRVT